MIPARRRGTADRRRTGIWVVRTRVSGDDDVSNPPRIGQDGQPAVDWDVNPKHLARLEREAAERTRLEAEQAEPWGRAKIERELARLSEKGSLGVVNGREVKNSLNLHGVDLSGQDLSGLDLSGANLHGAKLAGAKLTGCRLVGSNLHGADLSGAALDGANAVGANLHGACLCGAQVGKTHFMSANLSECCHEGADGLDVEVKPLTAAENTVARRRQADGVRAHIDVDAGVVRYFGDTLNGANVTEMSAKCKRK